MTSTARGVYVGSQQYAGRIKQGLPTSSDDDPPIQRRAEIPNTFRWRDHDDDRRLQSCGISDMRGLDRLGSLIDCPRLATGFCRCGPHRFCTHVGLLPASCSDVLRRGSLNRLSAHASASRQT